MRLAAPVLLLALILPLSGCDLLKKLSNEKVMAASLLETPSIAQAGYTVPGVVVASVFFGDRASDGSSVSGLGGAQVNVSWTDTGTGTHTVALTDAGGGNYEASSATVPALEYIPSVSYTFDVTYDGTGYSGTVTAPMPATIQQFQNAQVVSQSYAALADPWTLARTDGGGSGSMAFYAVYPFPQAGGALEGASMNCDNAPMSGSQLLQLVLDPGPWQQPSFALPKAKCFPQPGAYVVGLTNLAQGKPSDNLFLYSAVVAGTTEAGVLLLQ